MDNKIKEQLKQNSFVIDFTVPYIYNFHHSLDDLIEIFKKTSTLKKLASEYALIIGPKLGKDGDKELYKLWNEDESIKQSIRDVYDILNLPLIEE